MTSSNVTAANSITETNALKILFMLNQVAAFLKIKNCLQLSQLVSNDSS